MRDTLSLRWLSGKINPSLLHTRDAITVFDQHMLSAFPRNHYFVEAANDYHTLLGGPRPFLTFLLDLRYVLDFCQILDFGWMEIVDIAI